MHSLTLYVNGSAVAGCVSVSLRGLYDMKSRSLDYKDGGTGYPSYWSNDHNVPLPLGKHGRVLQTYRQPRAGNMAWISRIILKRRQSGVFIELLRGGALNADQMRYSCGALKIIDNFVDPRIEEMAIYRARARLAKKYYVADTIKAHLGIDGVLMRDHKEGCVWWRDRPAHIEHVEYCTFCNAAVESFIEIGDYDIACAACLPRAPLSFSLVVFPSSANRLPQVEFPAS